MSDHPYLTIDEAAELLRTSPRTIKRRPIPYYREGGRRLYDRADLLAYLQTCRQEGGASEPTPRLVVPEPIIPKTASGTSSTVRHRNKLFVMGGR